ncbi:hypothetical protein [Pedobacter agri]|uniref:Lipocalin-like domain-containing protein n=1 Tax=Pedobacter agri TaxID=454586 RepID=A0A9X3DCV2_9SPHI|nr:hypothetical protein [Pedobacter agri]MCX3264841.1 hypothetical protein [Pedobacter agri]
MKKLQYILIICLFYFTACKKNTGDQTPEIISENQQKIQGRWTQVYFKRFDYNKGNIDRVVEGEVKSGEYIEFFGNRYRFHNGTQMVDNGSTFSFDDGELAIRDGNTVFYSTIKWQSADAFIEVRDDGSAAGGPENKSVFEYSYVRKIN